VRVGGHTTSEGRGVGPIAVCPKMGLVAYAESTLQPKLFMLKYPDCSLVNTLRGLYARLIPFLWLVPRY